MTILIDRTLLQLCSDSALQRAIEDIKFEIANREYEKIKSQEEN